MFKLVENLAFWWPVKVTEPDPNRMGKTVEHTFEIQFELLPEEINRDSARERAAILSEINSETTDAEMVEIMARVAEHDEAAARRLVRDWRKIADEMGNPLNFSAETFTAVWAHERVRVAIVKAYQDAVTLDKARLKN
ncbi:hypothetical protein [Rhizobium sp. 9140]|uniref:hypothetical protein n=1 Tax=Rhizobium sp. 9140 TaxID=1761900 RepID=UPI00079BF0A6|nr:hypothetical protein [Rhizobium sp. 9140]CZT36414.1 hypothetical protein GA0004734_00034130 [Rhizobium sp. 9140]